MSSSTISVDVQRSTKLSDCENFQQSDRSGFSDTLQHTFHSPVESVGDAEYYQPAIPTSVHYYQPQQQQHIQASVYAARKSTDLTMLTASNPWLSVASTAHGTYLTQSCYYYAQSLPLNRHSQTFHAYQQAYWKILRVYSASLLKIPMTLAPLLTKHIVLLHIQHNTTQRWWRTQ